jgi:hypothetical protein
MAIAPLEDRLTAMMSDAGAPAPTGNESALQDAESDQIIPPEGVQVAGLEDVVRIIKQGTKSKNVLKQVANDNANAIEMLKEEATMAAEAKKKASTAEKAKATREANKAAKQEVAPVMPDSETTTILPEGQTDVIKMEPMVVDNVLPSTERPDLIPVVDAAKIKAYFTGEAPDDIPLDISFQNMKSPEDIDFVIRKTEEVFASEFSAAKRGVMSDDELNDLATQMNMAPDLLKRQIGTVYNAEQLQASKIVIKSSAMKIENMRQQIKALAETGKNDDALLVDFTNQLTVHAAMQMNFKAAKSEAGRALRASRVYKDDAGAIDAEQLTSMIAELGGAKNIKNMVNMMDLLNDAEKAKFIQEGGRRMQVIGNVWKEVWVSAIMSSPATFTRMFFGAAFQAFMRPIDTAFASTLGRATDFAWTKARGEVSEDFVSTAESAIELANFFTGSMDALRAASKAFKNDAPVYGVGRNIDTQPDPAITSKLFKDPDSPIAHMTDFAGKLIRLPFRGALFVDEGTKALVANMELRRIAGRDAAVNIKNGMSSDDAMMLMADEITNPSVDTLERIDLAVKEAALQSDVGGFGNWVMATRKALDNNPTGLPVGTLLAPFVKTVINAEKQILSRTPFAPVMSEVRAELQAGGARRQMALGKMYAGSAIMGTAYWMTTEGMLTGLGPSDPKKRQWLKENEGWQECSIKMNGTYYNIAGLEPVGGLLCSAATVAEMGAVYGKDDDASFNDLLLYSTLLPFKYIGQLPMMDGLGKLFEALQDVTRDTSGEKTGEIMNKFFGTYTQNLAGGVAPVPMPFSAMLRQIERTIDPTKRDVTLDPSLPSEVKYFDFAIRSWMAGTPLMSTDLKPKRNLWGTEVESASFMKDEKNDALSTKLRELSDKRGRMIVNYPSKTIDNVKLNDNEYSDLLLSMNKVSLNGVSLRQQMASDMTAFSSETKAGAFAGLAGKLSETVSAYRDEALKSPTMLVYQDMQRNIANNKAKADLHIDMIKREPKD